MTCFTFRAAVLSDTRLRFGDNLRAARVVFGWRQLVSHVKVGQLLNFLPFGFWSSGNFGSLRRLPPHIAQSFQCLGMNVRWGNFGCGGWLNSGLGRRRSGWTICRRALLRTAAFKEYLPGSFFQFARILNLITRRGHGGT